LGIVTRKDFLFFILFFYSNEIQGRAEQRNSGQDRATKFRAGRSFKLVMWHAGLFHALVEIHDGAPQHCGHSLVGNVDDVTKFELYPISSASRKVAPCPSSRGHPPSTLRLL
jgi:hypothetical protein